MPRRLILVLLALLLLFPQVARPLHAYAASEDDAPLGGFAGAIIDQLTGQPIPAVTVSVCRWQGANCNYQGQGGTIADGRFQVRGFMPGEYRVCFSHGRYITECYDDQPPGGDSARLTIEIDELVMDIDAALLPRGSIRGRVTEEVSGGVLPNIQVTAMAWRTAAWVGVGKTITGADGRYGLPLEAGSYQLRFSDPNRNHPDRYYAGASGGAVIVSLGTGQTVEGVDMVLPTLGHIAGQVTRRLTGEPLSGIKVTIRAWSPTGQALTDAQGRYDVGGLDTGEYRVEFQDEAHNYAYAVNGGGTNLWTAPPITVTLGQTITVDHALLDVGGLVGTAVDVGTGTPLEGMLPRPVLRRRQVAAGRADGRVPAGGGYAGGGCRAGAQHARSAVPDADPDTCGAWTGSAVFAGHRRPVARRPDRFRPPTKLGQPVRPDQGFRILAAISRARSGASPT